MGLYKTHKTIQPNPFKLKYHRDLERSPERSLTIPWFHRVSSRGREVPEPEGLIRGTQGCRSLASVPFTRPTFHPLDARVLGLI